MHPRSLNQSLNPNRRITMTRTTSLASSITMALALSACGGDTGASSDTSASPPAATAASGTAPEQATISAVELEAAYKADKEAWIGKQVTVAGTYGGHGQNVEGGVAKDFHVIVNTPGASFSERRNAATCYLDQAPADDVKSRGPQDALIVTGTVKAVPRGLVDNYARLNPCRIVQ
jgi:hypothetical protein